MTESAIRKELSESEFFSGLAPKHIEFLAAHATRRRLDVDDVLFEHSEAAHHFYLISSGHIRVGVPAIEGPALELQELGPGSVVGWSWLISPHRWSFQAKAMTPVELLEFDGDAVLARCDEDPRFGYELLKRFSTLMSERLHFARRKMMDEWRPSGFA